MSLGFQKKTISEYITKRVKYWVWSIRNLDALQALLQLSTNEKDKLTNEDNEKIAAFRREVLDGTIVTGGAIASLLLGEEPNDLDIYFTNTVIATNVAKYYLELMKIQGNLSETAYVPSIDVIPNLTNGVSVFIKSAGVSSEEIDTTKYGYFEQMSENAIDEFFEKYRKATSRNKDEKSHNVGFVTSNAISLKNGIQLILRFTGDPEQIHSNYDFVHATNYWTKSTGLVYRPEALQALLERRLIYIGSKFPVCSMFRLRKFIQRGFRVTAGEMTKIAYDISMLDLDNASVLHDQLIGVDYAYFCQVLAMLREREGDIDRTYLFQILDEVFQDEHDDAQIPFEAPNDIDSNYVTEDLPDNSAE